jgi:hypothetical protein
LEREKELEAAAPLLVDLLSDLESPQVKTDLVRLVATARVSPQPLVAELKRLRPQVEQEVKRSAALGRLSGADLVNELKRIRARSTGAASLAWALAEALESCVDASVYSELVEIVRDSRFGRVRQMLPYALAKVESKHDETIQVLVELLSDPDIAPQASDALARMGAVEATAAIRALVESDNQLVKSEARKALRRLENLQRSARKAQVAGQSQWRVPPPPDNLTEASTNFDLEDVAPFLRRLASLIEGLDVAEVERIESRLFKMGQGEEAYFAFLARYGGEETPLQIRIYMSDAGAPDVGFFTSSELAGDIERLMEELE